MGSQLWAAVGIGLCLCWLVAADSSRYAEFSAGKDEKALFPSIFNLATHSYITATATCGRNAPEEFCKLTEHVYRKTPQCDVCDANYVNRSHPIENAIDGSRLWWQSPSLSKGLAYEKVNITLDLHQEYQVAYVIVKAGISPRPGTWVLEKSLDGQNFTPWQYYARSDPECMRMFGVAASVGVPRFTSDSEVICTSYFSTLSPVERGEIHTSLVNGRPSAEAPSAELQNFTRARYIRLRLLKLRAMNADLMIINRRDERLDESVTRRYFYSISDISIGGQCICNGHAETCNIDQIYSGGQGACQCSHNTEGPSCSRCRPLYNQLPWRPGTHSQPNVCEACQCFNHAVECVYDPEIEQKQLSVTPEGKYEGGGRCLDCQDNTEGINCEKCKPEFYRPANVSHYIREACRPCQCDALGSVHNQCIQDATTAPEGSAPGDCVCKPGFGGQRCEKCAPGFRNYPVCDRCPCNQAGSRNYETCEEASCICKENVDGKLCDTCKAGTVYLNKDNPAGCQRCFCFGKTNDCVEQQWKTAVLTTVENWNLTDISGRWAVARPVENTALLTFTADEFPQTEQRSLVYWKAPPLFRGSRLTSYGANLHYFVYYVPSPQSRGQITPVADVVLEGNGLRIEYHSRINFFPRENISVTVPLKSGAGWFKAHNRQPVEKVDMMRVLANVDSLLVRARYHEEQSQSSIYGLRLEYGVNDGDTESDVIVPALVKLHPIEKCTCPENFVGLSCEGCRRGFRRIGNQLFEGHCERCECNGHSENCDAFTGHCIDCQHETTGPNCEQCKAGFYGNPSLGGEQGSCKQCACPTVENSHSSSCSLSSLLLDAANGEEYVCTNCQEGYDGNKCEICADGYFGDPVTGNCTKCDCNNNVDPMEIGNCDRQTGQCLRCIHHTAGDHCERCEDNHWGSALHHSCSECKCHHLGAVSPQCSNNTGACTCKETYTGSKCDSCIAGHGDVDSGCPACECSPIGSVGTECDAISGQCNCKHGVIGKRCDFCIPGYYKFSETGCTFCNCDARGAVPDKLCHNVTGECQCLPNVVGQRCEQCVDGFFNISSGNGCQECGCDPVGSLDSNCDSYFGQCRCKPGVEGNKCDKCSPNHYGFDQNGCKQCRRCPAPGQVCDPITGDCVCPPNTEGEMCERCIAGTWHHDPLKGCKSCDCSGIGADSAECDVATGNCKCKSGYVGARCDSCESGYFNFPNCEPCNCDLDGTDPSQCPNGQCSCTNDGQCQCKKNVGGLKCNECAANSFSLDKTNPQGCTECFCFNRTDFCVQHNVIWSQKYAPDREVKFEEPFEVFDRRHNVQVLKLEPLNYNSYTTGQHPLYWPLPPSFHGDRISSYNGFIRFRIINDDNYRGVTAVRPSRDDIHRFPQVILVGNNRVELEHVPVESADDGKYKVRLHESQWRNRLSPQILVSRKQFMVALQNVQGIYIRATYTDTYRGDVIRISEVSVDVAVEEAAAGGNTKSVAYGVEICEKCPPGYAGTSCQRAAAGYCRRRLHDYLNNPDDLALVGESTLCACNSHSEICDPENCRCSECHHNTMGDSCEFCRPGFYGNALEGREDSCKKCGCPSVENSFSPTCRAVPDGRGYVCDACRVGHTGAYCELCLPGYYGDPSIPGGSCQPCNCHPDGSIHGNCNPTTGQCECQKGLTGRACSVCAPKHAFMNRRCTSCEQGCHKDLMLMEDKMEEQLKSVDFTDLKPIPRKRLHRINTTAESLGQLLDTIRSSQDDANNLLSGMGEENRYVKQANALIQEYRVLGERNEDTLEKTKELTAEMGRIRQKAKERLDGVRADIHRLDAFVREMGSQAPATGEIDYLVHQAETYLNVLKANDADLEKHANYAKKNAEDTDILLKKILSRKLNNETFGFLDSAEIRLRQLAKDYRNAIWDKSRQNTNAANNLTAVVGQQLEQLNRMIAEISRNRDESDAHLAAAQNNVLRLRDQVDIIQKDYQQIDETSLPELRTQHEELLELINKFQENPLHQHVEKADRHAKELEHTARRLEMTFASAERSSSDTLAAANAYKEIAEALRNAKAAAEVAQTNAAEARAVVDPRSSDSLVKAANFTAEESKRLAANLMEEQEKLNVVAQDNRRLNAALQNLGAIETAANGNLSWIRESQMLLDDHNDRLMNVYETVGDAEKDTKEVETKVNDFIEDVKNLHQRAELVANFDQKNIREHIENVTESKSTIQRMVSSLEDVQQRAAQHDSQIKDIRKDLDVLKEKINEAREKASKIRIGVSAKPESNCVREYISPMNPSPSNSISLKYRPALDSPDSLIFFVATKGTRTQHREYIAIELKGKKIHVHWNIGSGRRDAAVMKKIISYIPTSDRYSWYQIDVNRIGNTMRVIVGKKRITGGDAAKDIEEPTEVIVGEPDVTGDVILNTVPGQTRVYVGHPDAQLTNELELATNRFSGILGEMVLDGVNVPLWVFDSSRGDCEGASGPPNAASIGHMFRNGFAQIRLTPDDRSTMMTSVSFSSYSDSGLLYFRGDSDSKDFFAIQLDDGAVVVKTRIGGSDASLRSERSDYADGHNHKIRTIRKDGELHLQIDEVDRISTAIDGDAQFRIANDQHYVGGVPSDFDRLAFGDGIRFDGFFGCIQSVRPTQLQDLELKHPVRSQRMELGCSFSENRLSPNDRVIGFPTAGYLLTKGIQLATDSTFSFNIRTRNPNAMLLYQSGTLEKRRRRQTEDPTFVAFYLFEGRLFAHLGTGPQQRSKLPSLSSAQTYNDGQMHSIFLARTPSEVIIRIDDREIITAPLEDETIIGSANSAMLLGGFPGDHSQQHQMGTSEPLIGCLSDFYLNYQKFTIIPEEHKATLGSCDLEPQLGGFGDLAATENQPSSLGRRNSPLTLNVEEPLVGSVKWHDARQHHRHAVRLGSTCWAAALAELSSDSENGVRFGLSSPSHSRIRLERPLPEIDNFTVDFSIRTTKRSGLLWVWANYRKYDRYYFLLLSGGFLKLQIKNAHRGLKTLRYNAIAVNDNEWHRVELRREGRRMSIQVDEYPIRSMRSAPKPRVARKQMFVGGVISKHRKQFNIPAAGFDGCLRDFRVNEIPYNLLTSNRDLIPCSHSPNIDYVHNGGYAMFDKLSNIGEIPTIEVAVQFKALSANRSLLIALADSESRTFQNNGLALLIVDGSLTFSISSPNQWGIMEKSLELPVCLNEWHRVVLKVGEAEVSVHLDEHSEKIPIDLGTNGISELQQHSVFLGGASEQLMKSVNATSTTGCLRHLELQKSITPLNKAKQTQKIVHNGCPTQ